MLRFILPLAFALTSCESAPDAAGPVPGEMESTGPVVATVNGHQVTQDMVDATLAQFPPDVLAQIESSGQLEQVKQQVVLGELLYQKAIEQGIHNQADTQKKLAISARNALADSYIDHVVEQRLTPQSVDEWYQSHLVQFARPQVRPSLMVLPDEDMANAVVAELSGGADFATLAKVKSMDPHSAPKGGDLGWMGKQELAGPFQAEIFGAEKGGLVGPIPTPNGVLLFKVEDKRDTVPLDEVRSDVESRMRQSLAQEIVEELRNTATIEFVDATATAEDAGDAGDASAEAEPTNAPTDGAATGPEGTEEESK